MDVGTVRRVDLEEKMRSAYLSYAMSVITARALPDVRDGLKPVQRRILYAMHDMGLRHDRPTRKSARIVGEVLGKYHPHNDVAVYDAMVRMAQDFSMRYLLVEGQGNFGSVDGDRAAAMRYTEARLSAIGEELLVDLDKETVDFAGNFDGSLKEPEVLPAKLPNLLVSGGAGIAVGMATNVPPHNLGEIADAVAYLVDHHRKVDDLTLDDLMQFVKGPDFPTGGTILGREGIRQAYAMGKGRVIVRAQAHVENLRGGRSAIIVTELPYQINKARLIERIADLVRDGRVQGIADLRDESDRAGMRIVIELKRGVDSGPVLGQLLKHTQMQSTFGVNMLALVDGEPHRLSLKRALVHHIDHRRQVLTRRTRYELDRAQARAHVLEGLRIALDNLEEIIDTIRRSRTADTAMRNLRTRFKLTEIQARAVLDMQLRRLASLERRRVEEEYREVLKRVRYLRGLLRSKRKLLGLIKEEVLDLKRNYGDARRTRISDLKESAEFRPEDLTPSEEVFVLLTRRGYVRRFPASVYSSGRRRVPGMSARERDVLQDLFVGNAQEAVIFFTNKGRAFSLPAHQLPDTTQEERGALVSGLVRLMEGEQVETMTNFTELVADQFLCMGTMQGKIKRLALGELATLGRSPAQVIRLAAEDALRWVVTSKAGDELVMVTAAGKAIRFSSEGVRPQGRSAGGVVGIRLSDDDAVVGMDVMRDGGELMVATALGYAKRTPMSEYSIQGRGGQGMLALDASKIESTGRISAAKIVLADEEVVFATARGNMLRASIADVPILPRASWGRLVTKTRRGAVVDLDDDTVTSIVGLARQPDGRRPGGRNQVASPSEGGASVRASNRGSARRKTGRRASGTAPASGSRAGRTRAEAAKPDGRKRARKRRPAKSRRPSAASVAGEDPKTAKGSDGPSTEPEQAAKPKAPAASRARRTRRATVTRTPRRRRPTE
jgi:DNA gyrase subunit A